MGVKYLSTAGSQIHCPEQKDLEEAAASRLELITDLPHS